MYNNQQQQTNPIITSTSNTNSTLIPTQPESPPADSSASVYATGTVLLLAGLGAAAGGILYIISKIPVTRQIIGWLGRLPGNALRYVFCRQESTSQVAISGRRRSDKTAVTDFDGLGDNDENDGQGRRGAVTNGDVGTTTQAAARHNNNNNTAVMANRGANDNAITHPPGPVDHADDPANAELTPIAHTCELVMIGRKKTLQFTDGRRGFVVRRVTYWDGGLQETRWQRKLDLKKHPQAARLSEALRGGRRGGG